MGQIKQTVAWWCFAGDMLQPAQLVQTAAEIGYEAIELVGQPYWPLVKEHGLQIATINGHASIENGLNRRENHERIEKEIRANLALARQWNVPNLIVFSGNREGLDDETGLAITVEGLQRVAGAAEEAGVTLLLELLNSKIDHHDYQCDHTAWGVEVCQKVASTRVKLLYDIYHMQIMEGDVIRTIHDHHSYFGHYHLAGNPGRHELDNRQELNYSAIMQAIRDTGYEGYIGQEFVPTGDPVLALKQAFDLCN